MRMVRWQLPAAPRPLAGRLMADFSDLVDFASDAAFAVAEDLRILAWNSGAQRVLGYAKSEVLGRYDPGHLRLSVTRLLPPAASWFHRNSMPERATMSGARHVGASFVGRMWLETQSNGQPVWRGHLRQVQSGEERHFESLAEMRTFLERLTGVPWRSTPTGTAEQVIVPKPSRTGNRE